MVLCQDTTSPCHRTNCQKNIGSDLTLYYSSFTKVPDKKFALWTADKVLSVTGTQKEREQSCTKQCAKDGKDVCRSVHLSPYQMNSPSTCELFNKDAYEHWSDVITSINIASAGWTTFHLFVSNSPINYLKLPEYVEIYACGKS